MLEAILHAAVQLHVADVEGSPEIVAYLIKRGVEVNVANQNGYTPLDVVIRGKVTFRTLQ